MFLLVRTYNRVILNILTSQKKNMTKLEFLWPVNTTGNFILSPGLIRELVQPKIQVNLPQFYQESLG